MTEFQTSHTDDCSQLFAMHSGPHSSYSNWSTRWSFYISPSFQQTGHFSRFLLQNGLNLEGVCAQSVHVDPFIFRSCISKHGIWVRVLRITVLLILLLISEPSEVVVSSTLHPRDLFLSLSQRNFLTVFIFLLNMIS